MKIFLEKFERGIVVILIGMMAVVVLLATIELGWIILKDIITPPVVLLEINEILEIFGFFLLILIGVELLETIKAYLRTNVIHVEVVLEVALIAIARKVIILDLKEYSELTFLGIAALILALAIAYVLLKFRNTLFQKRPDTIPVQEKTAAEKSRNKNQ
ncbi:MAG: phosphate-starvation-inducible PsiE family protein [Desulfobacterales bacterium]|nr:phosphate-starvation-inducible PsiE family protein [Desulfobacterales bacterium]